VTVPGVGEAGSAGGQTQTSIQSDWDRQKHVEQSPQTSSFSSFSEQKGQSEASSKP